MNDLNDVEQDNNRAGPSHDPAQHPGKFKIFFITIVYYNFFSFIVAEYRVYLSQLNTIQIAMTCI